MFLSEFLPEKHVQGNYENICIKRWSRIFSTVTHIGEGSSVIIKFH